MVEQITCRPLGTIGSFLYMSLVDVLMHFANAASALRDETTPGGQPTKEEVQCQKARKVWSKLRRHIYDARRNEYAMRRLFQGMHAFNSG